MAPRFDDTDGGWEEYKRLVLSEIQQLREDSSSLRDDLRESQQGMRDELRDFRTDVDAKFTEFAVNLGQLNVKAGMWGALAGAVLAGGSVLIQMLTR